MAIMTRVHIDEGYTVVEAGAQLVMGGGRCGALMKPAKLQQSHHAEVAIVSPRGAGVRRLPNNSNNASPPPPPPAAAATHKTLSCSSTCKFAQPAGLLKGDHDSLQKKGQTWVAATELDSDLLVKVADMSFHLHKFPLLSRSGRLNRLVFESRDTEKDCINMDDMPGGGDAFELAVKFCYGITVKITPRNVAALRCAAEYLEMTEEFEQHNLVTRAEAFLTSEVVTSWKKSITVLQTCEKLLPWAKELHIVKRCIESVAWKACTDPRGIRWSYSSSSSSSPSSSCSSASSACVLSSPSTTTSSTHSASSTAAAATTTSSMQQIPHDWWFEDASSLSLESFGYVMSAIRVKGMRPELMGAAVVYYAHKWVPELHRNYISSSPSSASSKDGSPNSKLEDSSLPPPAPSPPPSCIAPVDSPPKSRLGGNNKERTRSESTTTQNSSSSSRAMILERLVGMLPSQADAISCSTSLRLLRAASLLNASQVCMKELERRAGMQLESATLSDLLIPSFLHTSDTLYDIDIVHRVLEQFLVQDHIGVNKVWEGASKDKFTGDAVVHNNAPIGKPPVAPHTAKMKVAKLIDSYLAEVGRDGQLPCVKFQALAEALPEFSRVTDDGLYRAIDTYLKAHPGISEHERKKLCRMMDCQRLSLEACMHAAENERLPLRIVIQVLFSEQLKLRNAITGSSFVRNYQPSDSPLKQEAMGGSQQVTLVSQSGHENSSTQMDIKALQQDVMFMKAKFMELHQDYSAVTQQLEKLTKQKAHQPSWVSGLKRLSHVFHHKDSSVGVSPLQSTRSSRPWRSTIS
ncbi:hypothetical protein BDL97_06G075200 [Sphagnum fallax]|nr:hypothetical protein BDL97_06G075200 [Sphagnum fallax]